MFINEVEGIVGLSKKSIRYYEENGLLTPTRNTQNDYRIYTEEDVKKLKGIKFLRELGVPICELKKLNDGSLTLQDCMKDRIKKIEYEEGNYHKVKKICISIMESKDIEKELDMASYFQQINQLGKEGFTLRDVKTSKKKKIIGAVLSSVLFSLFFLFLIGIITYFQLTEADKIPWVVYGVLIFILALPVIAIGSNLVIRIKEINGGEEDEASKY